MDYTYVLKQIFELLVFPVLSIAGIYLTYFIGTKISELKQKTNNDLINKYLDILDEVVTNAVLATTQTYVDSLKKQGKFDEEAQKAAFKQTYDAVMQVLTADAVKYITVAVGDLEVYVTNKIEANVKLTKTVE